MTGAWVSWGPRPITTTHATDPVAERVADLHVVLEEGPARDTMRDGEPVFAADLAAHPTRARWPAFAHSAQAAGARGIVTAPMRLEQKTIGVLGLYSHTRAPLDDSRREEIEGFAELALGIILDHHQLSSTDSWLSLTADAEVHQASGIVSVQLGVGVDESLLRLRAHAFAHGRSLSEIAREVVTRRLRFMPNTPRHGERQL